MNDDVDRINAEIDRLALKTTDQLPMQLFVERFNLQKRMRAWKFGGMAIGVLAGAIALFALFWKDDYGVPEASAVAIAVVFLISLVGRADLNAKTENWLARARQVVGE